MKYAIITGASKGIGRALAEECARLGRNLVLVSLPNENLRNLASQLSLKYEVRVIYKELNLNDANAIDELYHWCEDRDLAIDMMINNAGLGMQQAFNSTSFVQNQQLMRLNMEATVLLCSRFLPILRAQRKAYILNMGSIASFMHIPYKSVYAASKNFVVAFSNALGHELKQDNITVTCLCPGPTITNDKVAARVDEQGLKARMITFTAEEVARKGIKGLFAGKRVIIPGAINKLLVTLSWILPRPWSLKLCSKVFAKSQIDESYKPEKAVSSKIL